MGTARTSPKVVRERRARGIRSNRGKVRRHFPKAHRNDRNLEVVAREGKAWSPTPDPLEIAAERLVALVNASPSIREDVTQEVWVQLLEGCSEDEIVSELSSIMRREKEFAFGRWGNVSLDKAIGFDGNSSLGDFVDADGVVRLHGGQKPIDPFFTCACGVECRSPYAKRCRACWVRLGQIGRERTGATRQRMSETRRELWRGPYGEMRRAALNVTEKVCRRCGYEGPWENFAKNPNCYGGRDKICKPCMVISVRAYKLRQKQMQAAA